MDTEKIFKHEIPQKDLKRGDIVWAVGFERHDNGQTFNLYQEPIKGMLTKAYYQSTKECYNDSKQFQFPVTSFSYFIPFKKTAKQLDLDGLAWSKAVQRYSRHYARTEEEAILLFNEIIEDANAYLKTVIANNADCKLDEPVKTVSENNDDIKDLSDDRYDMTPDDKKSNMAYWDDIDDACQQFFDKMCSDYAMCKCNTLDEDSKIDISKAIMETIIDKCKSHGLDTDKMFPYVDCDY